MKGRAMVLGTVRALICFSANIDLSFLRERLQMLAKKEYHFFYCCFPTREQLLAANMNTDVSSVLEEVLGGRMVYTTSGYSTLSDVYLNSEVIKETTLNTINKIYILDANVNCFIADEVASFTDNRVEMLY